MYPNRSSRDEGVYTDVRPGYIAEAFGLPEDSVRAAMPLTGSSKDAHGEIYWFRSVQNVEQLVDVLSLARQA